jgi:hypothetical protein
MTSHRQPEDRPRDKLRELSRRARPRGRLLAWAALAAAGVAGVGALTLAGPGLANANTRNTELSGDRADVGDGHG